MNSKLSLVFLFVSFIALSCNHENVEIQSLHSDWFFRQEGSNQFYHADIPGCVHTDLLVNKIIKDPFFRDNENKLQWIGKKSWIYTDTIDVNPSLLEKDNIIINFEGLDTYASVILNDSLIIEADNMFINWTADVKSLLKIRQNVLKISFVSIEEVNSEKAEAYSVKLPDDRAFSRKAPYMFGWDWGPKFLTTGVWRDVYLEAWNDFRIRDVYYELKSLDEKKAEYNVILTLDSDIQDDANLEILNANNGASWVDEDFKILPGTNTYRFDLSVPDPVLWWPAEIGNPYLYKLQLTVSSSGREDMIHEKIGVRTVEVVHEEDEYGMSFYFKLNDLPVFIKGANYIPMDAFPSRVIRDDYESLISQAIDANMNMLRVWGGGIYEDKAFYRICDSLGIMVWQDFMFACNMYPGDKDFLESVEREVKENIIRLRNHPSVVIWCGNNEIVEGWHNWGWQKALNYSEEDSARVWNDYKKIFHEIIPEAVEKYDPQRFYWPSSPKYGWGRDTSYKDGDVHYWGVWWGEKAFESYKEKVGRFNSEYGFQGFPDMATIDSVTHPGDRQLGTEAMQVHQKHPRGYELIQTYMERWYDVPDDFEYYVYVSQLLQAEGMRMAMEAHRRAMPYSMGTLFWQLNDCWPVVSWAGIDYYGNKKALHYAAKRSFQDLLIAADRMQDTVDVYVVSDFPKTLDTELELKILNMRGEQIYGSEKNVHPYYGSSEIVWSFNINKILEGYDPASCFLLAQLKNGDSVLSEKIEYFKNPKDLNLENPQISFDIEKSNDGYLLTFISKALAKNVYISIPGYKIVSSDNYFDLRPGTEKNVQIIADSKLKDLKRNIKIMSLNDLY